MKRPDTMQRARLAALLLATAATTLQAAVPEAIPRGWYHVELLVFARSDAASLAAEQWQPLPTLTYPESYRFLVDPALADRRVAESGAFLSRIDARGLQALTVPAPIDATDAAERPDALIGEPWQEEDPDATPAPESVPGALDPGAADSALTGPDSAPPAMPVMLQRPLALPYQLLGEDDLEFRAQARALRRGGDQVLFHGSWWAPLPEGGSALPLVLDHSADADTRDWPALQGSVHLYRTRYLHIDVDLWLNTMASYLPAGWQIEAPPRPAPALTAMTLSGVTLDPWAAPSTDTAPIPTPIEALTVPAPLRDRQGLRVPDTGSGSAMDVAPDPAPVATTIYPWRHAIVHRQARRMRSGEIHYLDHPVLGVIVRVRPVEDDLLPLVDEDALSFRERHGLPVEWVELPEPSASGAP